MPTKTIQDALDPPDACSDEKAAPKPAVRSERGANAQAGLADGG